MKVSKRLARGLLAAGSLAWAGCGVGAESEEAPSDAQAASAACSQTLTVASVSASAADTTTPATNVLDNNYATRWSGKGVGTSITATLSAAAKVCSVQIAWYEGNARKNHFIIAVSQDGKTFTDVVSQDSSGTSTALETYSFSTPQVARYVRLTVNGNTANTWASVTELRVAGTTDITAPDTVLAPSGPAEGSTQSSTGATFAFSSTESGSTFQCSLDSAAWASCTSPKSLTGLSTGAHTFHVRAVDAEGNVDASPAQRHWTVQPSPPGYVKPGPTNTGIPAGTVLTRLDGDQVINAAWMAAHPTGLPAGAGKGVMQDQDIYGKLEIKVPGFTLRRSRVRGEQKQLTIGDWSALIFVTVGDATHDEHDTVLIEDCEAAPSFPSPATNGIFGYNFTVRRTNLHHSVDGFGVLFYTHVESNWVHDLSYYDNDGGHSNGTHNDTVQMHNITYGPVNGHGGYNTVVGNFLSAFIAQDAGTPQTQAAVQFGVLGQGWDHQAMSGLMINSNFKNTVTDNWVEGGYYPINGGDTGNVGNDLGTWERNQFDRMRYDNPGAYYKNSSGSFNANPRYTLVFAKGSVVNTGAGTADANRFEPNPVTPGVTGGAEVLVRYY